MLLWLLFAWSWRLLPPPQPSPPSCYYLNIQLVCAEWMQIHGSMNISWKVKGVSKNMCSAGIDNFWIVFCLSFFSISVPLLLCREIKIPVDKCVGVNVLVEMEYIVPQFAAGAFPGGSVVESACQGSSHGFDSWSGKMPHATEQLSPGATTTESVL